MPYAVQASNLSCGYPQRGRGLAPSSLDLSPGEAVHIAGPSGSGKPTLARCLIGALGGLLGALTLKALRKAGFFAYLAEKR